MGWRPLIGKLVFRAVLGGVDRLIGKLWLRAVPCGGRKTSSRTSTIVQFIFYFGPLRSAIIF